MYQAFRKITKNKKQVTVRPNWILSSIKQVADRLSKHHSRKPQAKPIKKPRQMLIDMEEQRNFYNVYNMALGGYIACSSMEALTSIWILLPLAASWQQQEDAYQDACGIAGLNSPLDNPQTQQFSNKKIEQENNQNTAQYRSDHAIKP